MSEIETGGPAFPTRDHDYGYYGMTLRDYFAAKAMHAAITGMSTRRETFTYKDVGGFSYEVADAMLKAREL